MNPRTTEQLARIKQLLIADCNDWLSLGNTIITDDGKTKMDGMGQVYVAIVDEGRTLEPYGDCTFFAKTTIGVYVSYSLDVDLKSQYSRLTTVIVDKAEKIIDCLHMRYDDLWPEPIKLSSAMRVDIDRNSNWAVCGLKFDVLQVEYYLR